MCVVLNVTRVENAFDKIATGTSYDDFGIFNDI